MTRSVTIEMSRELDKDIETDGRLLWHLHTFRGQAVVTLLSLLTTGAFIVGFGFDEILIQLAEFFVSLMCIFGVALLTTIVFDSSRYKNKALIQFAE